MAIEKWVIAPGESRVIDLELVRKLKVSLIGGKVDVIAHDEPGARVEISGVTGKDLMVAIDGDILEIDHPQLRWDNFIDVFKGFVGSAKAEVSILAPRHVALKLGVVSGDALVSGFTTDAKFSTVSGDLVLDNHEGDVELSSVSGEMSAGNHIGRITAHSVSGDVVATGDMRVVQRRHGLGQHDRRRLRHAPTASTRTPSRATSRCASSRAPAPATASTRSAARCCSTT